jgi:hypothetical protein
MLPFGMMIMMIMVIISNEPCEILNGADHKYNYEYFMIDLYVHMAAVSDELACSRSVHTVMDHRLVGFNV